MSKPKGAVRRKRGKAARIANDRSVRAELARAGRHASAMVALTRGRRGVELVEGLCDPKLREHGRAAVGSLERAAAAARSAPVRRRRNVTLGMVALGLGAAAAVVAAKAGA